MNFRHHLITPTTKSDFALNGVALCMTEFISSQGNFMWSVMAGTDGM